jgi:hypothetical protein
VTLCRGLVTPDFAGGRAARTALQRDRAVAQIFNLRYDCFEALDAGFGL